jgi:hypothetical protein
MELERWVITSHVRLRKDLAADTVNSAREEAGFMLTENATFVLGEATKYLALTAASNIIDENTMILAATGRGTGPRKGPTLQSGAAESSLLTLTKSLESQKMQDVMMISGGTGTNMSTRKMPVLLSGPVKRSATTTIRSPKRQENQDRTSLLSATGNSTMTEAKTPTRLLDAVEESSNTPKGSTTRLKGSEVTMALAKTGAETIKETRPILPSDVAKDL